MKKALCAAMLIVVASVAACGGSSSSGATGAATSADRDKFVGTWVGHYGCFAGATVEDTMIISAGSGDLGLSIKIHTTFANPDTVSGTLTSPTHVDIPEQSMGGAMGTATITLKGATLEFSATGAGITCGGTDYAKAP